MINLHKIIVIVITIAASLLFLIGVVLASEDYRFSPRIDLNEEWVLWDVWMPNHSLEQIMYINYAYEISGHDKEFIYMLKNENGLISPDRKHDPSRNKVGVDLGFCGVNDYYHPEIVNDPMFKDWKWQLEKCYDMYKSGVTFYGKGKGWKVKHFFKFR